MTTPDYVRAHRHSNHHREEVLKSEICGCFDCLAMFPPANIKEWCDEFALQEKDEAIGQTALCPFCEIDSVIGSESGYPITKEFLKQMQDYWFGSVGIDLSGKV